MIGFQVNPLLPFPADLAWTMSLAVMATLVVAALVSIRRSRLDATLSFGWTVVVLLLPVLGAVSWFIVGRRGARHTNDPVEADRRDR